MSERVRVNISGGTFALCIWIFLIFLALRDISSTLRQIRDRLPRPVAEEVTK